LRFAGWWNWLAKAERTTKSATKDLDHKLAQFSPPGLEVRRYEDGIASLIQRPQTVDEFTCGYYVAPGSCIADE
jgi:hypothetical protein